jgi:hypothetical protein
MKKSPLAKVKEQFGSKDKLVDALIALPASVVERGEEGEEDKDAFRKRLLGASNAKLLRLHTTGKSVSERFGSKGKLVDAILNLHKRGKDQDYRNKLSTLPLGKLFDQVSALEKGVRRAERAAKPKVKRATPVAPVKAATPAKVTVVKKSHKPIRKLNKK